MSDIAQQFYLHSYSLPTAVCARGRIMKAGNTTGGNAEEFSK
jgi:hypothetical protein